MLLALDFRNVRVSQRGHEIALMKSWIGWSGLVLYVVLQASLVPSETMESRLGPVWVFTVILCFVGAAAARRSLRNAGEHGELASRSELSRGDLSRKRVRARQLCLVSFLLLSIVPALLLLSGIAPGPRPLPENWGGEALRGYGTLSWWLVALPALGSVIGVWWIVFKSSGCCSQAPGDDPARG
jgi:hypothetical protein